MPPFDFKKEFKELYKSTKKPRVVATSLANFLAVCGKGDPNEYGDQAVLEWACAEAARKKKIDASKVEIVAAIAKI